MQHATSGTQHNYDKWSYTFIQACLHGLLHTHCSNVKATLCSSRLAETERKSKDFFSVCLKYYFSVMLTTR